MFDLNENMSLKIGNFDLESKEEFVTNDPFSRGALCLAMKVASTLLKVVFS